MNTRPPTWRLRAIGFNSSGPKDEPWVTNGERIAGLEPQESSIAAIDWITSVGAISTAGRARSSAS